MANEGTARPMFEMLTESSPKRRLWPSHTASGTARSTAAARATNEISACCTRRLGMPDAPCQFSRIRNHDTTEPRKFMPGPCFRRAG